MANKDFKVKNGLDIQTPLPVSMGGTGQTSTSNTLNSLLPAQSGNQNKVLSTDGTNTTWIAQATAYQRGGTASRPASPTVGDLYYNTDNNYFESYTANGWFPIAAAPLAPTGVTATNTPTNRAYNDGRMTVAFTPNSSGGAPSSFIVTPSPSTSPSTFTGSTSPIAVTGLASSTQYTYTVQATSPYGTSSASSASTGVTATTVPQAPSLSATSADSQATITITPGATGGSSITQYTITSNPATTTQTTSNTTYTFTGLTNGTAYTFTATATNANGTSVASAASNSVTPSIPSDFYSIQTVTVDSGSSSTISFNSIPQTYKHLQLRIYGHPGSADAKLSLNGSDASQIQQSYSTGVSSPSVGSFGGPGYIDAGATTIAQPESCIIDIYNYTDTDKLKFAASTFGYDYNGSGRVGYCSFVYGTTSAVTSLSLYNRSWSAPSHFALYGVK